MVRFIFLFVLSKCMSGEEGNPKLDRLFRNPKSYRTDDRTFRASNLVFPVFYDSKKYVVKMSREFSEFINLYYWFQDLFFYGSRRWPINDPDKCLEEESQKLESLAGFYSPELIEYRDGTLVREFRPGKDFRSLDSDERRRVVLEEGIEALEQIHGKGIIVGDAHVKNLFDDVERGVIWLGMSGVFRESPKEIARAIDVIKFVYSTWTATRNHDITLYAAEIAARYKGVKDQVRNLIDPGRSSLMLWFPTRIPVCGSLNKKIKMILKGR